jgi:uncharacterized protein
MTRIVLIALVVGLLLWWVGSRARARPSKRSDAPHSPQAFARCAHCGVHLPMSDAVLEHDVAYCSEAHRLAGPHDRGAG